MVSVVLSPALLEEEGLSVDVVSVDDTEISINVVDKSV